MSIYEGGFAAPVAQAQAAFRAVMEAMSRPGRIARLGEGLAPPAPLSPASAAVLLSLADPETPVWLEDAPPEAAEWLRFHTGAPRADDVGAAAFALLAPQGDVAGWGRYAAGRATDPHLSASLILPVEEFDGGAELRLAGPGINGVARIAPTGLPNGFVAAMAANRALFPMGFDLLLTCGTQLLALPRTTRITEG
jgi:alpha-D-ribose 1-methylphosphonate 5-triphosphate synthase subunit PhnH